MPKLQLIYSYNYYYYYDCLILAGHNLISVEDEEEKRGNYC